MNNSCSVRNTREAEIVVACFRMMYRFGMLRYYVDHGRYGTRHLPCHTHIYTHVHSCRFADRALCPMFYSLFLPTSCFIPSLTHKTSVSCLLHVYIGSLFQIPRYIPYLAPVSISPDPDSTPVLTTVIHFRSSYFRNGPYTFPPLLSILHYVLCLQRMSISLPRYAFTHSTLYMDGAQWIMYVSSQMTNHSLSTQPFIVHTLYRSRILTLQAKVQGPECISCLYLMILHTYC